MIEDLVNTDDDTGYIELLSILQIRKSISQNHWRIRLEKEMIHEKRPLRGGGVGKIDLFRFQSFQNKHLKSKTF